MTKCDSYKTTTLAVSAAISWLLPTNGQELTEGKPTDLEAMVVQAGTYAEPLKDVPVRTEMIERDLIESTSSRDLAQIIQYTPGLRVETTCSNCNPQSIQMLGLPQSYIAILTDGLPTFSGLAGVYGIEQIPTGLMERIEVVKGGGSPLYGPGAVAGVINLVPRQPEKTGGSIEWNLAAMEGRQVGGALNPSAFGVYDWVSPEKNFTLSVFGNYDLMQAVDLNADGFTDVSERELTSGGLRATWQPLQGSKWTFDYFASDEGRRGGEAGAAFNGPPNRALIAEEIFTFRQVATLKWEQEINDRFRMQHSYAFAGTDRDSYYGGTVALGSPDPSSAFFDPTWTAQRGFGTTTSDLHFFESLVIQEQSEDHQFTYGLQHRNERLVDQQAAVGRSIDDTYTNTGLLFQHRWKWNDRYTAEYGGRMDIHSEVADPILSPRANLLIQANDSLRIRNSLSWGFRAPEVFDEDLHIANVGGDLSAIRNDPNLEEETSITFSVAPEWQINDQWRLEVNGFHTWLNDTFSVVANDDPMTADVMEFLKQNGGASRISGVELNLGFRPSDAWRMEFSWTQQRARFEENQLILGDDSLGDPIDNPIFSSTYARTPESLGLLRFFYTGKHFDAFVGGKITGPMDVPHIVSDDDGNLVGNRLVSTPWFFNLDVGISREIDLGHAQTLTLTAGIKNLLDDFQSDLERGPFRDAGYVYGPAFPRTYHMGARWSF
jgi:outer membrane receptor for ferrienterochelin and colicins